MLGASTQIDRIGSLCVPGWARLLTVEDSAAPAEARVRLQPHQCLRLAAAAQPSSAPLEVSLHAPSGAPEASAKAITPMLVGKDGPVCVGEAGDYTIKVRPVQGTVRVWVGAWASPKGSL